MPNYNLVRYFTPFVWGLGAFSILGFGWLAINYPNWFWLTLAVVAGLLWRAWKWLKG